MLEAFILGAIQGIAEWLPVSSEGLLIIAQSFFSPDTTIGEALSAALFLHLGTVLAAIVYFWSEIKDLFQKLFNYRHEQASTKATLNFYIIATAVSGILGIIFVLLVENFHTTFETIGTWLFVAIGIMLLVTAALQFFGKQLADRPVSSLNWKDSILTGIAQGLAAIPGISRSGSTTAALLALRFSEIDALRLSFILSIPIVILGNIALQIKGFSMQATDLIALATSFVFGLATIHLLLKIARKLAVGWFVLIFGLLMIVLPFIL